MCDPITLLVVGTVATVVGQIDAAEDAEDAYHKQAANSVIEGQHRQQVALYNAGIFKEQAARLRNEMVGRLNEVSGVNITRITEDELRNVARLKADRLTTTARTQIDRFTDVGLLQDNRTTQLGRLEDVLGIRVDRSEKEASILTGRLKEDFERLAVELNLDAKKDFNRIEQITGETLNRLGRRAVDVAITGFEIENDLREDIQQDVSAQRSFYAAGNIIVNSGTPMRLQTDSFQQGQVQLQRIRRDYRIKVQDIKDNASDTLRDALFTVEDIKTDLNRRVGSAQRQTARVTQDINRTTAINVFDLIQAAGFDAEDINLQTDIRLNDVNLEANRVLKDLNLAVGTKIEDIERDTDLRVEDTNRNLGYDLTDLEFNANKLDQQATLTLIQGDADLAAAVNRADALETAGSDAFTGGLLGAAGSGLTGVSNVWYASNSAANNAPVSTSTPDFVNTSL